MALVKPEPDGAARSERIVFMFRGGRRALAEQIAAGTAPDEFLYGLPQVQAVFAATSMVEAEGKGVWLPRLLRPLEFVSLQLGFGLFFDAIFRNWRTLQDAQLIVATTDSTGIPLLVLKRAGLLAAPVIVISQGLHSIAETNRTLPWANQLRGVLGGLLARAAAIIALGDGDAVAIARTFATSALPEVVTLQFGIDDRFWQPAATADAGEDFVLSVGSDRLRDYPTLLRAIDATPLRLVTRLPLPPELLRPNVRPESDLSWPELRTLYQRARFVVTPVLEQPRDSGHSATLQAMACGKAVILSNTAGLWDRARMRHGETCFLVEPENADALRAAIAHLWSHPDEAERIGRNARRLVEESYASAAFGAGLRRVIVRQLSI